MKKNLFYQHKNTPTCKLDSGALKGLRHKTVIDANTGAKELALWQEEHMPGFEVPLHLHDCEEIITVLSGQIEAQIGNKIFIVKAQESILIEEATPHGFKVISAIPIKILALFSSASPKILKLDGSISKPPWKGGKSDHLKIT